MQAKGLKIALITPWNIPCGIATYSAALSIAYEMAGARLMIFREGEHWHRGQPLTALAREIKRQEPDIIHIQHEYGLFPDARHWLAFLTQLSWHRAIYVTLHSVFQHRDKTICEAAIPHIIVHSNSAEITLHEKGVTRPITTITHGCHYQDSVPRLWNLYRSPHTVVQFGFGFRYKGWEHSIQTIAELKKEYPDIFFTGLFSLTKFDMYGHLQYFMELNEMIQALDLEENVALIPGFLDGRALDSYLRTNAVGLFPYASHPEHEVYGASGAIRVAMANKIPVVASTMHHFDDLEGVVPRAKTPVDSAVAIKRLFDEKEAARQVAAQDQFCQDHSWLRIGEEHLKLFCERGA